MPLRPRPAVPMPSGLSTSGAEAPSIAASVLQLVPAVTHPARVQPAKQTVYNMFTDQARHGHTHPRPAVYTLHMHAAGNQTSSELGRSWHGLCLIDARAGGGGAQPVYCLLGSFHRPHGLFQKNLIQTNPDMDVIQLGLATFQNCMSCSWTDLLIMPHTLMLLTA